MGPYSIRHGVGLRRLSNRIHEWVIQDPPRIEGQKAPEDGGRWGEITPNLLCAIMNKYYCPDSARAMIDAFFARTSQDDESMPPLLANVQPEEYCVTEFDKPKSFRITKGSDTDNEAYFRVIGVICSKVLPPILHKPKLVSMTHIRNLRQFVKMTGFASQSFEQGFRTVETFVDKLRDHIGVDISTGMEPKMYEGDLALDFHARYFTDRELSPHEKHIPFGKEVDPLHVLEDLRGAAFIHGADNHVEYCVRGACADGNIEYSAFDPSKFKEGDIVEVTLSLVCVPIRNNQYKILLAMRALTLLSSAAREESEKHRAEEVSSISIKTEKRNLKRRTIFLDTSGRDRKLLRGVDGVASMDM